MNELIWTLSFAFFFKGLLECLPVFQRIREWLPSARKRDDLKAAMSQLRFLKENLECGLVPDKEDWKKVGFLAEPWGPIFDASLRTLRERGAPILPSLERMIRGLEEERELLMESETRSSQALGQAILSVGLVPFFALMLFYLLPGIQESMWTFLCLVLFSLLLSMLALIWILGMTENARFGKIHRNKRNWILSSKIFFEKMIAEVMGGSPPDLAWSLAVEFMSRHEPEMTLEWGNQLWDPIRIPEGTGIEKSIVRFGGEMRRCIQVSLLEGRGSLDHLDAIYRNHHCELRTSIVRELQILPNECLKPLFLLVLPAVLLLLFGSMGISFMRIFS